MLLPSIEAAFAVTTNAGGFVHLPLALPRAAVWRGVALYAQAFVLDPAAPSGVSLSSGLRLSLGD